jgi:UDP-GlcNAc3NAcA epimerase
MRSLKILTVVGARPQFVKAAALSPVLARHEGVTEIIVHTGQHFDVNMSDIFFSEMAIPEPKHNLGIGGGTHGQNTGRMIEALEAVLLAENPDAVVVYGDTDSTLAASVATSKLAIPLAHIEAGLRSFRRTMPEEINRVVTDHLADVLYAPSASSVANLSREGIPQDRIVNCGDVMYDVVRLFNSIALDRSTALDRLELRPGEYSLMTLHRKENTDDRARMESILAGIAASPRPIVFPIHPRTTKRIAEFGLKLPGIVRTVEPQGYLDTLRLEAGAHQILTDSGGVQKEAYFHGVPCVTLRDETEWVELVECGANTLVGADPARIAACLTGSTPTSATPNIYGDGHAAERIVADLLRRLRS